MELTVEFRPAPAGETTPTEYATDYRDGYFDGERAGQVASRASSEEVARREAKMIRVWRWEDAPAELQALSRHGGDEDWVAHIPLALEGEWIGWAIAGTSFGCCDVSEHTLADGSLVRIGAHA